MPFQSLRALQPASLTDKKPHARHVWWFKRSRDEVRLGLARPGEETAIGRLDYGTAHVNCCLQGSQSLWGTLGGESAVIVKLMVDMIQPEDFKLSQLEMELCLSKNDPRKSTAVPIQDHTLKLFQKPSPVHVQGRAFVQKVSVKSTIQPEVAINVLGSSGSFGGVGREKTTEQEIRKAWHWHGHWKPDDIETWRYTKAIWLWKAVSESSEVETMGDLYGSMVVQHAEQPFWITCNLEGRLVKGDKRFRYGTHERGGGVTQVQIVSSAEDLTQRVRELESELLRLILKQNVKVIGGEDEEQEALINRVKMDTAAIETAHTKLKSFFQTPEGSVSPGLVFRGLLLCFCFCFCFCFWLSPWITAMSAWWAIAITIFGLKFLWPELDLMKTFYNVLAELYAQYEGWMHPKQA